MLQTFGKDSRFTRNGTRNKIYDGKRKEQIRRKFALDEVQFVSISTVENRDCMEAMKQFPDKYFDLAVVDPPYGGGFTEYNQCDTENPKNLRGGGTDYESRSSSRFGGWFDKYHISREDGRNMVDEVSDAHRGYL